MVDELAEVGVGRRDVGVARRIAWVGIAHGLAEADQVVAGGAPFGQQVVRVVLQAWKEKIEVLHIGRLRRGKGKRKLRGGFRQRLAGAAKCFQ